MPGQMMTCGPCAGPEPHRHIGDVWVCATCEHRRQESLVTLLADALAAAKVAMHRGEFGDKGRDRDVPSKVDAALRAAGRIP